MADAVTNVTLVDGPRHTVIHLTSVSDGTGESAVIKANISELADMTNAGEADYFSIERVKYNIQGFADVRLLWDATTDVTALVLAGGTEGDVDFRQAGGLVDAAVGDAGHTGDIVLTSPATAGGTYDITMWLKKHQARAS